MPSTVQGLVLVFARMINLNPLETLNFLGAFSIENRMVFKKKKYLFLLFFFLFCDIQVTIE